MPEAFSEDLQHSASGRPTLWEREKQMTKITQQLTLIGMMLPIATVGAWEIDPYFSLDPASPSLQPDDLTPDDVFNSGPAVQKHGRDLGLSDNFLAGEFDTLNALSFGRDPIKAPLTSRWTG